MELGCVGRHLLTMCRVKPISFCCNTSLCNNIWTQDTTTVQAETSSKREGGLYGWPYVWHCWSYLVTSVPCGTTRPLPPTTTIAIIHRSPLPPPPPTTITHCHDHHHHHLPPLPPHTTTTATTHHHCHHTLPPTTTVPTHHHHHHPLPPPCIQCLQCLSYLSLNMTTNPTGRPVVGLNRAQHLRVQYVFTGLVSTKMFQRHTYM